MRTHRQAAQARHRANCTKRRTDPEKLSELPRPGRIISSEEPQTAPCESGNMHGDRTSRRSYRDHGSQTQPATARNPNPAIHDSLRKQNAIVPSILKTCSAQGDYPGFRLENHASRAGRTRIGHICHPFDSLKYLGAKSQCIILEGELAQFAVNLHISP